MLVSVESKDPEARYRLCIDRIATEYLGWKDDQILDTLATRQTLRSKRKSVIEDLLKRDLTESTRKLLEKRLAELDR